MKNKMKNKMKKKQMKNKKTFFIQNMESNQPK